MNKKYCCISFVLYSFVWLLSMILIFSKSETYVMMSSILLPILIGIIINYDNKQKEVYKVYYQPLFHFIKTYYDILSQPNERLKMGKKHEMMSSLSKDLIRFLNDNLKYASEELSDLLSITFFYQYENEKIPNEFQDIYNVNKLIPVITKKLVENYNVLHIEQTFKRKKYLNKVYHEVNGVIFLYVDSFLIDIARKKQYVISPYETVEFYKIIDKYRTKHFKEYYKIYKYIKRNRKKDINLIKKGLKSKFNISIKKIK